MLSSALLYALVASSSFYHASAAAIAPLPLHLPARHSQGRRAACPIKLAQNVTISSTSRPVLTAPASNGSSSTLTTIVDVTVTRFSSSSSRIATTTRSSTPTASPSLSQSATSQSSSSVISTTSRVQTSTAQSSSRVNSTTSRSRLSTVSSSVVRTSTTKTSTSATTSPSVRCPAGSKFARISDDFATFDTNKWSREAGSPGASTFGKDGLIMTLNKDEQNVVYQSTSQWLPPVSMAVSMQSAQAPGIVSCAIFKNADASDEIDLELVENSWQVPIWEKAQRVEFGRDATGQLSSGVRNHTSWVYSGPDGFVPSQKVHKYEVQWTADSLTWDIDGARRLSVDRLSGSQRWPTQKLHVRFGPWVAGLWAGKVDFEKNPSPRQRITQLTIEGCMAE